MAEVVAYSHDLYLDPAHEKDRQIECFRSEETFYHEVHNWKWKNNFFLIDETILINISFKIYSECCRHNVDFENSLLKDIDHICIFVSDFDIREHGFYEVALINYKTHDSKKWCFPRVRYTDQYLEIAYSEIIEAIPDGPSQISISTVSNKTETKKIKYILARSTEREL